MPIICHFRDCKSVSGLKSVSRKKRYWWYSKYQDYKGKCKFCLVDSWHEMDWECLKAKDRKTYTD